MTLERKDRNVRSDDDQHREECRTSNFGRGGENDLFQRPEITLEAPLMS